MPKAIDYNRGVHKQADNTSGVEVYMYVDDPGVFLNAFGNPVTDAVAKSAGYDVERLKKLRLKKQRLADAARLIEQELDVPEGAVRKVDGEKAGFKVLDIGLDRYHVEDPDGNQLTPHPVPKAVAYTLLEQLTSGAEVGPKEKPKPTPPSK